MEWPNGDYSSLCIIPVVSVGLGFAMVGFDFDGFTLNLRGMAMWHVIGSIAALSCRCEQL